MSTPPDFGDAQNELISPPYEPSPGPPPTTVTPILRRSSTDKVVAGVAGGLGRYLGIDPVILRVAFVVLTLAGLAGILVYIVGWIAIPEEKPGEEVGASEHSGGNTARMILGGLLILVGGAALFDNLIPDLSKFFWPAAIILLGAGVLFGGMGRRS